MLIPLLSSCGKNYGTNKEKSRFSDRINQAYTHLGVEETMAIGGTTPEVMRELTYKMSLLYGVNKEFTKDDYNHNTAVKTTHGTYVGLGIGDGIVSWKGIPYAKAPINELRWKAPQKLEPGDKVYEAYHFGHSAIQLYSNDEPSGFYPQGEDCLNLNIWLNKADNTQKKPVMVWIHGGGYIQGGGNEAEYDGTNFVTYNPDIIYVSIDYRVDMLGFINLTEVPGGEKYAESANLGLLDEVAALSWIQENIAAFGGDPERVTIFGESAGGGSCSALTIMPQAKGLFKRAIIQSGSVTNLLRTEELSRSHTQQILDISGCKNMDDLLELTPNDIRKLSHIRDLGGPASYTFPQLDDVVLPKNLKQIIDSSDCRDGIDIMSGTTLDEYNYWTKIMTEQLNGPASKKALDNFYNNILNDEQKLRYDAFRATLTSPTEYQKNVDTISYLSFHTPCRYEAKAHSSRGNKIYQYLFSEQSGEVDGQRFGAYHGFELEFLFANYGEDLGCTMLNAFKLSLIMQKMWVNFASRGDPSIKEGDLQGIPAIPWEAYTAENESVMNITSSVIEQVEDPFSDDLALIGDLYWAKLKK